MAKGIFKIAVFVLVFAEMASGQIVSEEHNFILQHSVLVPGFKTSGDLENQTVEEISWQVKYYDGLGRNIHKILIGASPTKRSIYMHYEFNEYGRQKVHFLPFGTTAADGNYFDYIQNYQTEFYKSETSPIAEDTRPWAESIYEASPIQRLIAQSSAGDAWRPANGHVVNFEYAGNLSSEVLLFTYDEETNQVSVVENDVLTYYDANALTVRRTLDEHGNEHLEYSDKNGRIICKKEQYDTDNTVTPANILYAETYYVYDNYGNLVCVMPPQGVAKIIDYWK